MARIFIALGTNTGDRRRNLAAALQALEEEVIIGKKSRLYETDPMYVTDQPTFINMAIAGETALGPYGLLGFLKRLEKELGRKQTFRNGPRMIDLDILYYDDLLMDAADLQIPHLRIAERLFVLYPMQDLEAEFVDVRTGQNISNMLKKINNVNNVKILPDLCQTDLIIS